MHVLVTINRKVIQRNRDEGVNDPPIGVTKNGVTTYAYEVEAVGTSRFIYQDVAVPDQIHLWVEVEGDVTIIR